MTNAFQVATFRQTTESMENTIATRIYDFLKDYPPFNLLEEALLRRVAARVVVQYRRPGEVIFRQGDPPGQYLYVIREGAVHLVVKKEGEEVLIDECDEGDLFGIRPLLADEDYVLTARATEESLIYAINFSGFEELLMANPKVSFYLASSFAAGRQIKSNTHFHDHSFVDGQRLPNAGFKLVEIQSLERSKAPVTCELQTPLRQAAATMSDQEVGSIIVCDTAGLPLGIITDKDLRRKVATGLVPLDEPVSSIMSSPVITMPPTVTVADVQIEMVKKKVHHLCLTEDGTNATRVVGVISEHDILVLQGNNPAVLIRESGRASSGRQLRHIRERAEALLRQYLQQEVSIAFISTMMTEVNDAVIMRAIELAREEAAVGDKTYPEVPFCWLSLGSEGRGEQLLRTDQDSALIFADQEPDRRESVREYFLELAERAVEHLHQAGFAYCPAAMMASNPRWCLSLSEWKSQFSDWILEPTPKAVMHSTIFFDFRPVFGEEELARQLTHHIFEELDQQTAFLTFLAKSALQNPPPLTFFRNFVVEKGGEHADQFDIKARAMMPLADAARVLSLQAKLRGVTNTFLRFESIAELEPRNRELYLESAGAYEMLMRYRTLQGLLHQDSGRYFDPEDLSKMERVNLRNSFRPIRELQSLLATRFQTAYLR